MDERGRSREARVEEEGEEEGEEEEREVVDLEGHRGAYQITPPWRASSGAKAGVRWADEWCSDCRSYECPLMDGIVLDSERSRVESSMYRKYSSTVSQR